MKTRVLKLSIPVVLLVALATIMLMVASSASAAPGPFAAGGGVVVDVTHFSFSAGSHSNSPYGAAQIDDPTFFMQGPVICFVKTAPNAARFSIMASKVSGDAVAWTGFLFDVTDNSPPSQRGRTL